jgi:Lipocalin-like domain
MNRYGVNCFRVSLPGAVATTALAFLWLGLSIPAMAQSLQQRIVGTWTLESGSENYADGKRIASWATGNLMIDANGHATLFLVGRDQPATSPSVRTPVGPFVAYYGTYTVNEAENVLTLKVDHASSPLFNGSARTQKISFTGDIMTWTGSELKTPEGTMTPVNQWRPAK